MTVRILCLYVCDRERERKRDHLLAQAFLKQSKLTCACVCKIDVKEQETSI